MASHKNANSALSPKERTSSVGDILGSTIMTMLAGFGGILFRLGVPVASELADQEDSRRAKEELAYHDRQLAHYREARLAPDDYMKRNKTVVNSGPELK